MISHHPIKETEESILKNFGEKIRTLRKIKGWSQEELAFQAGLDRTYISGIERGRRNISLINIHRIAQALNVNLLNEG